TFRINTNPMFLATSRAIGHMRGRGGSVVIISSVLATSPSPVHFATHAYASAKGAANSYVKTLAAYYAVDGIRVNAIAPGLVRTPMSERAASDPETVEYAARKQPLAGGFLEADDIAGTAVFLLSDESSQVTGQVIAVDGGWGVTEA
ncbi:MAG: SDR family NAD(P)-dependent oxidoreductase, partial [Acidimicrobiia bacterium]